LSCVNFDPKPSWYAYKLKNKGAGNPSRLTRPTRDPDSPAATKRRFHGQGERTIYCRNTDTRLDAVRDCNDCFKDFPLKRVRNADLPSLGEDRFLIWQ
jgi:hypothetical protein